MSKLYENIECSEYEIIELEPHQIGDNLYNNIKENLKKKLEKKCNHLGYIIEIFKINEYKTLEIKPSSFSGNCPFKVLYSCRICRPQKGQIITGKIINISGMIAAKNGPIDMIIQSENINKNKFIINNNIIYYIDKNKKKVEINKNELLKIKVLDIHMLKNDDKIFVIGYLEDITEEEDKKQFFDDIYYKQDKDEFI